MDTHTESTLYAHTLFCYCLSLFHKQTHTHGKHIDSRYTHFDTHTNTHSHTGHTHFYWSSSLHLKNNYTADRPTSALSAREEGGGGLSKEGERELEDSTQMEESKHKYDEKGKDNVDRYQQFSVNINV